jgi:hypothetical protein
MINILYLVMRQRAERLSLGLNPITGLAMDKDSLAAYCVDHNMTLEEAHTLFKERWDRRKFR